MRSYFARLSGLAVIATSIASFSFVTSAASFAQTASTSKPQLQARAASTNGHAVSFGGPRIQFEPNRGQAAKGAEFLARGAGYEFLLGSSRATFDFGQGIGSAAGRQLTLSFAAASKNVVVEGEQQLPGRNNYLPTGNPATWHSGIPTYAQVRYRGIYSGIDLTFYGSSATPANTTATANRLEYDFTVAPGASPEAIRLALAGADTTALDAQGNLLLSMGDRQVRLLKPMAYQLGADGKRNPVDAAYFLEEKNKNHDSQEATVAVFKLGSYNRNLPLVIDPVVDYSFYLAGSGAATPYVGASTTDAGGNTYVTGYLSNQTFYIAKYNSTGQSVFNTVLGSGFSGNPTAIAFDASGDIYVAGSVANSASLPTTANAYQTATSATGADSAFLAVLKSDGSALTYCTYLNGTGPISATASGIAVDASGDAYITGTVNAAGFPTTGSAYAPSFPTGATTSAFVSQINPAASGSASLVYSTYLGSSVATSGNAIALDSSDDAYITGETSGAGFPTTGSAYAYGGAYPSSTGNDTVFVTELNPTGSALVYSSLVGPGSGNAIAVDGSGDAYLAGQVLEPDYPTTTGAYQTAYPSGFVTQLGAQGTALVYSTYLSGPSGANANSSVTASSIAIPAGCSSSCPTYIAGYTTTTDFPLIGDVQGFIPGGTGNSAFLVELNGTGSQASLSSYFATGPSATLDLTYGTPHAGVDSSGDIYLAGNVLSTGLPVTQVTPGTTGEAFLAQIGTANSANLVPVPLSVNFGSQSIDVGTSQKPTVLLENLGSASATISSISFQPSGEFTETDNCAGSVAAGGYCTLTLNFVPTSDGVQSSVLTVASTGGNPTIALTGTGTGATPAAATPVLSPAGGTYTSAQSVTITDATPGATIYYTTNGTTPTTASAVYASPIAVTTTGTSIKVIAIAKNYNNSAEASAKYTLNAPAPVFSLATGKYVGAQTTSISDALNGATIYYTTNGTVPTTSSPVYSGGPIAVTATETIEAIAVATGFNNSATGTATYTLQASTPILSLAAGTYYGSQSLTIADATSTATIYYTTNGTAPTTSSAKYTAAITIGSSETVEAIAVATGYSNSAVVSAAYSVTTKTATPAFSLAGGSYAGMQSIAISDSTPNATIYYTTNGTTPTTSSTPYSGAINVTGTETIEAIAATKNLTNSAIATATYTIQVPAPFFSVIEGTYTSPQTVSILDLQSDAAIYYTTNGTVPSKSSTLYTAPITVSTSETIEAIAIASGDASSEVAISPYTIQVATPVFTPPAGTYTSPQTVSITDTTANSTIYYTTNGTTPSTSSPVYTGPISVGTNETIEAVATATGQSSSAIAAGTYSFQVASPVISPASGTYSTNQTVTITTSATGSTIYYTTNGTTPTTSSTPYTGPFTVSTNETVEAIAVINGQTNSAPASATYNFQVATPVISPVGGTYTSTQTVTITDTSANSTIYYTTNGQVPTTSSAVYTGPISVASTQTIEAIAAVPGQTSSPAASAAYTINPPAPAPTFNPPAGTYTSIQSVSIADSAAGTTIYYTTNGTVPTTSSAVYTGTIAVSSSETLLALASGNGYSASPVTSAVYTISLTAATPVISLASGSYTGPQTVTISDATNGATIYYTTNGATPTASSAVYSGPISISVSGTTLKAIAGGNGYNNSAVASTTYSLTAPTPTFTPAQGTYVGAQTVSIVDSLGAGTIYYTTNGATPTTSSSVYSGPIAVGQTETIKAVEVAAGYSSSVTGISAYTLQAMVPVFSLASGTFNTPQSLTITDSTPGSTIYYTTNGSTPTTSSTAYTGAITVGATETVKATAIAPGYNISGVTSVPYTLQAVPPVFSLAAGVYYGSQTLTITDSTANSTIYYTTNGSGPTTSSAVYTGPITVAQTETVKALASASGYQSSTVTSNAYSISTTTATPVFSLASGAYTGTQSVSIADATSGATIYYTTNGTAPNTSSAVYTGPLTVSSTETIKALAVYTGLANSFVASSSYTITP